MTPEAARTAILDALLRDVAEEDELVAQLRRVEFAVAEALQRVGGAEVGEARAVGAQQP